jgi:MFS family permease
MGALGAMPVSIFMRRLGARRALIFGLVAIGFGSAIGAAASSAAILILSRAIEGLGLLATVLVIPDLVQQTVATRDRDLMLAIWGSYMPIGTVLMLLVGPVLPEIGWRTLWTFNAILPIAYATLCFFRFGLANAVQREARILAMSKRCFARRLSLSRARLWPLFVFLRGDRRLHATHSGHAAAFIGCCGRPVHNGGRCRECCRQHYSRRAAARRHSRLGKCRDEF